MESPEPTKIQYTAPFDDEDADLIIHSSDDIYFRVYRLFLRKASPVFADMFSIPTASDTLDTVQTVSVTEDGKTMDALLRLCYPTNDPRVKTLDELSTLMNVCEKYMMDSVFGRLVRTNLANFMTKEPIRVYAIACRAHADQEAKQAAYHCLTKPLREILGYDTPEFQHISVAAYRSLLEYHNTCRRTALYALCDRDYNSSHCDQAFCWEFTYNSSNESDHTCGFVEYGWDQDGEFSPRVSRWWADLIEPLRRYLEHEAAPLALQLWDHVNYPRDLACEYCRSRYMDDLHVYFAGLVYAIETKVRGVRLRLKY
ncbi:hypothetical protein BDY19DRAFT_469852 [Irpex rosettiformis]|uniref:Uncharacterized protein n=1 Tax=Irpex rosettiformis TaxID=378272 RepID=A0ACB8TS81_9APHY|nr:hypothetical protein BDY19DRAFT_469852 [Irpex rosettiformis]